MVMLGIVTEFPIGPMLWSTRMSYAYCLEMICFPFVVLCYFLIGAYPSMHYMILTSMRTLVLELFGQ